MKIPKIKPIMETLNIPGKAATFYDLPEQGCYELAVLVAVEDDYIVVREPDIDITRDAIVVDVEV